MYQYYGYPPNARMKRDAFGNVYFDIEEPTLPPPTISQPPKSEPPYVLVDNEEMAIDYDMSKVPVGDIILLALTDDTSIVAKRINPSNYVPEIAVYDKRVKAESLPSTTDNKALNNIDTRLESIEQFINTASTMLLKSAIEEKPKRKTVTKEDILDD
jgi:hypothetical protein